MRILTILMLAMTITSCARRESPALERQAGDTGDEAHGENHIEEANVFELSLEAQRRAGIAVQPVRMSEVEVRIKAAGTVKPVDSRIVQVRPLARGRLLQVLARTGDRKSVV